MRIKKFLLGLASILCLFILCGCELSKNISGVIDCYSIEVKYHTDSSSYSSTNNYNYDVSYSSVYEYEDCDGHLLYSNRKYSDGVKVFNSKYNNESTIYSFTKFIGYLTVEKNYFLNLDNMTIDKEILYSKYKYDTNPSNTTDIEINPDNNKAYECAKKGYFTNFSTEELYENNRYYYIYTLVLDMAESSLSRHSYIKLSADATVTYTPKWF